MIACGPVEPRRPEPSLDAGLCEAGQVSVCLGRCATVARFTTQRNALCERCSTSGSSCPVSSYSEVDGRFVPVTTTRAVGPVTVSYTEVRQTMNSTGSPVSPCCNPAEICAGPGSGEPARCCRGVGTECTSAAECCSAMVSVLGVRRVVAASCAPTPLSAGRNVCRPPEVCSRTSDCSQLFGRQDCFISGAIGLCGPCGSSGGSCCPTGPQCDAFSQCNSGQCTACGGLNEPCCGGRSCRDGNTCVAGVCRSPCGEPGQQCCPGGACGGLNTCDSATNTCVPCGRLGQQCCATTTGPFCAAGLGCDPRGDHWSCQPCGGANQVCCPGTAGPTCNSPSLACSPSGTRVCEPCGGPNQLCCTSGTPCPGADECGEDRRCGGPCGGQGQRCCVGAVTLCRVGLCEGGTCQ
jgi:hypothetical protein